MTENAAPQQPDPSAVDATTPPGSFSGQARIQRLNMLYHLVQHAEGMVLVTGAHGIGKTSMIERLRAMGNDAWRLHVVTANPLMTQDQLLDEIAGGFGITPAADAAETLQRLQRRLEELQRGMHTAILVIDDADQLATAALGSLAQLAAAGAQDTTLLRLVLVATPDLDGMLAAPELAAVHALLAHRIEVPPFDEQETRAYLTACMGARATELSDNLITRIHRRTDGVPGRINKIAEEEIRYATKAAGAARSATTRRTDWRRYASALGVVVAAALLTLLFLKDRLSDDVPGDGAEAIDTATAPRSTKVLPLPAAGGGDAAREPVVDLGVDVGADTPVFDIRRKNPFTIPSYVRYINPARSAVEPAAPAYDEPQPGVDEAVAETVEVEPEPVAQSARVPAPAAAEPAVEKAAPTPPTAAEAPPPEPPVTRAPQPPAPAPVTPEPAPTTTAAIAPTASQARKSPTLSPKSSPGAAWLAQQTPAHFTLQVMGSRSEAAIRKAIERHKLAGKAHYVRTRHKGADWYVLLYGAFPSYAQAKAEIARLPAALRRAGPWPRRLDEIKPTE